VLAFEASQLEIGTFHPEATLTQFVVDPFPPDANNPMTAQVGQNHSSVTSPTPVTFPLDVQVSYTKIVNINDVFDMAYSIDLNLTGNGKINMIPTTDVISFALPAGVFLTSALGATFGTAPPVTGDYNANGVVDAADYVVWRKTLGQTVAGLPADGDGSGTIDTGDFDVWKAHFGNTAGSGAALDPAAIPEPISRMLFLCSTGIWAIPMMRAHRGK
jgi:hypothetical protein